MSDLQYNIIELNISQDMNYRGRTTITVFAFIVSDDRTFYEICLL